MGNRSILVPLLLVVGLAVGCGDRDAAPSASPAEAPVAAAPGGGPGPAGAAVVDRALRITTETTIVTSDVGRAATAIREAAVQTGGFVSDANVDGGEEMRNATLALRIPADRLDEFRSGFSAIGKVVSDSEKAEDVTEQRADLTARLRNARAQEKRLLDLLSDRTGSLADVIAAEKALAEARDTIERLEAQEEVLEGQIRLATVKVHLRRDHVEAPKTAGDRIAKAARDGLENAGDAALGVVVVAATAGPTLLLFLAIGLGLFFSIRKIGRRLGWWRPMMRPQPVWYPQHASAVPAAPPAPPPPASDQAQG